MCGISGLFSTSDMRLSASESASIFRTLLMLSESRGKEASGVACLNSETVKILRSNLKATTIVNKSLYKDIVDSMLPANNVADGQKNYAALIGHSRLATTGSQSQSRNNQPVRSNDTICIHNGIVVNYERLWQKYPALHRTSDLDSEVIAALIENFASEQGFSGAAGHAVSLVDGTASIAVLSARYGELVLATNNGSIYYLMSDNNHLFMFASERFILSQTIQKHPKLLKTEGLQIKQLKPGSVLSLSLINGNCTLRPLQHSTMLTSLNGTQLAINEFSLTKSYEKSEGAAHLNVGIQRKSVEISKRIDKIKRLFPHDTSWQDSLLRCTRCILPGTMPYIVFDNDGVCNYCKCYTKLRYRSFDELKQPASANKKTSDNDCIVALSGGRDSVYVLHYVKKILGMNPVAYTYDWGMVTDLARRNIARICGKLGVEHIIISADINRKRKYICNNVTAWLKRPSLGMIPLFMAGDKQYFYYLEQLKKRMGIQVAFLGENMLERTNFKSGFAGVKPYFGDPERVSTLPLLSRLRMALFYSAQYLVNPSYINSSLFDTMFAALSYYGIRREYINLFAYFPWDEREIISTIQSEYDFELSSDTEGTWRIGDGTSAFYNYIYHTIAGFTEHDTFRSNQIREGVLSRADALKLIKKENHPRYETIDWYLDIIGIRMPVEEVFTIINKAPRVNPKQAEN